MNWEEYGIIFQTPPAQARILARSEIFDKREPVCILTRMQCNTYKSTSMFNTSQLHCGSHLGSGVKPPFSHTHPRRNLHVASA